MKCSLKLGMMSFVCGISFLASGFVYAASAAGTAKKATPVVEQKASPVAPAAAQEPVKSTLDNLQAAFNGESNAHARYLAFAEKARAEGVLGVQQLFLAAAKAEEIHAAGHARVIKSLNAEPKADVKAPEVKSTLENLQAALAGESYERDVMYPEFIKKAEADGNQAAMRTFRGAQIAETEHAKLYQDAVNNLAAWKTVTKTIIVCQNCGYTTTDMTLVKCVVCAYPRNQFIEFK